MTLIVLHRLWVAAQWGQQSAVGLTRRHQREGLMVTVGVGSSSVW